MVHALLKGLDSLGSVLLIRLLSLLHSESRLAVVRANFEHHRRAHLSLGLLSSQLLSLSLRHLLLLLLLELLLLVLSCRR